MTTLVIHIVARDAGALQAAIEHAAGRSDERVAREVLAIARLLADQHHLCIGRPFADHRPRRALPQVTRAALLHSLREVGAAGPLWHRGGLAVLRSRGGLAVDVIGFLP